MTGPRTPAHRPRSKFLFWITSGKPFPVHLAQTRRLRPSPVVSMIMSGTAARVALPDSWLRSLQGCGASGRTGRVGLLTLHLEPPHHRAPRVLCVVDAQIPVHFAPR